MTERQEILDDMARNLASMDPPARQVFHTTPAGLRKILPTLRRLPWWLAWTDWRAVRILIPWQLFLVLRRRWGLPLELGGVNGWTRDANGTLSFNGIPIRVVDEDE